MSPAVGTAIETITTWLQLIVTIGAVASLFYALSKFAGKPNRTQDERLDALEKWKEKVDERLIVGNTHFDSIDKGNEVTQSALLAIMDALISGDNKDELTQARKDLNKYLVHKRNEGRAAGPRL